MFTVIFTGSREYGASFKVRDVLGSLWRANNYDIFVKVGDCPSGVDHVVLSWCETAWEENTNRYKVFKADWKTYGKAAGPIRNHAMVDSGADLVVAFPQEGSKGTKNCAEYAYKQGIPVYFPDLPSWAQWAAPIAEWHDD